MAASSRPAPWSASPSAPKTARRHVSTASVRWSSDGLFPGRKCGRGRHSLTRPVASGRRLRRRTGGAYTSDPRRRARTAREGPPCTSRPAATGSRPRPRIDGRSMFVPAGAPPAGRGYSPRPRGRRALGSSRRPRGTRAPQSSPRPRARRARGFSRPRRARRAHGFSRRLRARRARACSRRLRARRDRACSRALRARRPPRRVPRPARATIELVAFSTVEEATSAGGPIVKIQAWVWVRSGVFSSSSTASRLVYFCSWRPGARCGSGSWPSSLSTGSIRWRFDRSSARR